MPESRRGGRGVRLPDAVEHGSLVAGLEGTSSERLHIADSSSLGHVDGKENAHLLNRLYRERRNHVIRTLVKDEQHAEEIIGATTSAEPVGVISEHTKGSCADQNTSIVQEDQSFYSDLFWNRVGAKSPPPKPVVTGFNTVRGTKLAGVGDISFDPLARRNNVAGSLKARIRAASAQPRSRPKKILQDKSDHGSDGGADLLFRAQHSPNNGRHITESARATADSLKESLGNDRIGAVGLHFGFGSPENSIVDSGGVREHGLVPSTTNQDVSSSVRYVHDDVSSTQCVQDAEDIVCTLQKEFDQVREAMLKIVQQRNIFTVVPEVEPELHHSNAFQSATRLSPIPETGEEFAEESIPEEIHIETDSNDIHDAVGSGLGHTYRPSTPNRATRVVDAATVSDAAWVVLEYEVNTPDHKYIHTNRLTANDENQNATCFTPPAAPMIGAWATPPMATTGVDLVGIGDMVVPLCRGELESQHLFGVADEKRCSGDVSPVCKMAPDGTNVVFASIRVEDACGYEEVPEANPASVLSSTVDRLGLIKNDLRNSREKFVEKLAELSNGFDKPDKHDGAQSHDSGPVVALENCSEGETLPELTDILHNLPEVKQMANLESFTSMLQRRDVSIAAGAKKIVDRHSARAMFDSLPCVQESLINAPSVRGGRLHRKDVPGTCTIPDLSPLVVDSSACQCSAGVLSTAMGDMAAAGGDVVVPATLDQSVPTKVIPRHLQPTAASEHRRRSATQIHRQHIRSRKSTSHSPGCAQHTSSGARKRPASTPGVRSGRQAMHCLSSAPATERVKSSSVLLDQSRLRKVQNHPHRSAGEFFQHNIEWKEERLRQNARALELKKREVLLSM